VPRQVRPRHLIPFAFVAALVAGGLASLFSTPVRWMWLTMVGSYVAATLGVGVALARRGRARLWWRLPGVFFILHAAYGTGYAVGLVRFARYWRASATSGSRRSPTAAGDPRGADRPPDSDGPDWVKGSRTGS